MLAFPGNFKYMITNQQERTKMKKLGVYIFFGLMALSACNLVQFERKNFITTGESDTSKRDYTSAEITGLLRDVNTRNKKISQHGHCWDTVFNPTIDGNTQLTQLGEKTSPGNYTSMLTNLLTNTKYFVRGYFIDQDGQVEYGKNFELPLSLVTTLVIFPKDSSADVTGLTSIHASDPISQHGHCWSQTNTEPTISDSITKLGVRTTTDVFTSNIKNLTPVTRYYVRSYIITSKDTLYGKVGRFDTTPAD